MCEGLPVSYTNIYNRTQEIVPEEGQMRSTWHSPGHQVAGGSWEVVGGGPCSFQKPLPPTPGPGKPQPKPTPTG